MEHLPGDNFELAVPEGPYRNGLDDAHLFDRGRQFIEGGVLKLLARLVRIRANAVHRHFRHAAKQSGAVLELIELALPLRFGCIPAALFVRRLLVPVLRQESIEAFAKC